MRPMTEPARQTVAHSAAMAFGGQLLRSTFAMLGTLLVSRALGPEGRGQVAVASAAALSFGALCLLSLESSNTFFLAQRRFSLSVIARASSTAALLVAPVALLLQAVFFVATRHSVFSGVGTAAVLIAAATVPFTVHLNWLINLFQLGSRLIRSQVALAAGATAQFIGIVAFTALGHMTVVVALVLYAANVVGAWLLHVVWGRSFLTIRPLRERAPVAEIVGYGLRLHPSFLFWFLLLRVDVLLVNLLLSTYEAGLYSIAALVAEIILLLSTPIAAAVLPIQSAQGVREAAGVTFKAVRFNCLLAVVFSLGFAASMWLIIPVVFGADFGSAYRPMLALLPGVIAMTAYQPLYAWLVRQRRARRLTAMTGLAFSANVVLNVVLLPTAGLVGAAVASSLCYAALAAALVAWGLRVGGLSAREALTPGPEDIRTLRRHGRRAWRALLRGAVPPRPSGP